MSRGEFNRYLSNDEGPGSQVDAIVPLLTAQSGLVPLIGLMDVGIDAPRFILAAVEHHGR